MSKIVLNGKSYELKYTIESWKKLKEKHGITPNNFQEKLTEDFAGVISGIVYYGIKPSERTEIKIEELDESLGFDVVDVIFQAIMENMPKSVNKQGTPDVEDGAGKKK